MNNKKLLNICYKFFNSYINAKELIKLLDGVNKKDDNKDFDELKEGIKKIYESLSAEDKDMERDSYDYWYAITDYISNNDYFDECFDSMTNYELLEFIAQYVSAPFPPNLDVSKLNDLISEGIKNDEKEWLWRLAFNYEKTEMDFDAIADYYIKMNDAYYLSELICIVSTKLNLDDIIEKVKDKEIMSDLKEKKDLIDIYFNEKQLKELFD